MFHQLSSRSLRASALLLLLGLASPAAVAQLAATTQYFPLASSNRWTYQTGATQVTNTVQGTTPVSGATAYVLGGTDGKYVYLTNDGNGYREHGIRVPNGVCFSGFGCFTYVATFDPPVTLMAANAAVGQTYSSSGNANVQVIGLDDYRLSYTATSTLQGIETVTTAAGTYSALKMNYSIRVTGEAEGQPINVTLSATDWLAPGVGVVKEVAGNVTASLVSTNVTAQSTSQIDCLLSWAERNYPSLFSPPASSQTLSPYRYRYYAGTNAYLGVSTADNHVYYLAGGQMSDVGLASTWYSTAGCSQ